MNELISAEFKKNSQDQATKLGHEFESHEFELDWLKKWSQYTPNRSALVDGDTQQELTYSQMFDQAQKAAHLLKHKYNIGQGDRVLHFSTNEVYSFVLYFALARLGAMLVPINYRLTPREITYLISNSEPALIVYEQQYHGLLKEIEQDIHVPESHWLQIKGTSSSFVESVQNYTHKFEDFHSTTETTGMIIYTSGTTGFPKGAMISHKALFWNSVNTALRLNITSTDSAVIFLPLFHTGGWNVLSTPFFHHGAQVVLTKKFDADQILNLSSKYKSTLLFGVPTTMGMMSRSNIFSTVDLSTIRYAIVGGEPMPIEQIEIWQKKNIPIRQGFGLTEFGPNVFSLGEADSIRKKGSIGFPNFYSEVSVRDDDGHALAADEIGELWLKGPMCMTGYWKNPKATAETIQDGWLKTGDLVRYDSEGYFYVVGRKKEMYKSGGENVYPVEIEQVIQKLDWIKEAAVIGIHDDQWGEVGHAFVSVKGDYYDEQVLREHCLKNLAKFKNPKFFTLLKDLPKGDSGKILKRELKKI